MKSQQSIQYALMCLKALDAKVHQPQSVMEVSRRQGVPLPECREILSCLSAAGLIESQDGGRFSLQRSLSDLSALEVVQAIARPIQKRPGFQMLIGIDRRWVLHKTLEAVRWAERHGIYLSDSGKA